MRGDGRVFLRGDRFWIAYYGPGDDGHAALIREPAKRPDGTLARTEKEARRCLKARREDVAMHRRGVRPFQGPRAERLAFANLLDVVQQHAETHGHKSLPQIRSRVKRLRGHFAGYRALAVTSSELLRYVTDRQADGAAPATINRELEVVGRAFALAVKAGTLSFAPPVPSLPEHNARQGFFERADFERVLSHLADPDLQDFLAWFFWTGMRPGEIRGLTWAAFDRETWTLRLHARDAKIGHGRVIPLVGELRAVIERRVKARRLDCDRIFHRGGQPVGTFRKVWAKACQAAGLAVTEERDGKTVIRPLRLPYDLRRTAVRNMVRGGTDPAIAMKISGHRTRATFDRYNIVSEDDLRTAIQKTTTYVASLPTMSSVVPLRAVEATRQ